MNIKKICRSFLLLIAVIFYFGILNLGFCPVYMHNVFGQVPPDALVNQFFNAQSGTPIAYYIKYTIFAFIPALIVLLLTIYAFRRYKQPQHRKIRTCLHVLVVVVMLLAFTNFERYTHVTRHLWYNFYDNPLIENNYVDTKNVALTFPAKKQNLIYIWSESMESSYQDPANGGCMKENLIPELTRLAKDNYSFSVNKDLGGFSPVQTATYTLGSMVAQMSGLPYIVPFRQPNDTPPGAFLPGAYNLGDILAKEGYKNVFYSGASAKFGRQENWFLQHGDYEVCDLNWFKRTGKVPEDYMKFWGIEDIKLFAFAKERLTELAKSSQPFNFQLELMDTHGPEGWPTAGYTASKYPDDQYANVLIGASKMINEFVDWIKAQPFYKDTTIIIVGDHFTMAPDYHRHYLPNLRPSVYNCIINPRLTTAEKNEFQRQKEAITMDMFPTTLAALGVKIPGNRLALGTNLFSAEAPLAQRVGLAAINEAFSQNSKFYCNKFLHKDWLKQPVEDEETQD